MENGTKLDLSDWLILAAIAFYIWYMFFPDLPKKCLKDGCDNYRDEKEIFCDYHIKKDEEKRQESYERMQKLKEWEKNSKKKNTNTSSTNDKNYHVYYSDIYDVHKYSNADDFADDWEDDFDNWDDAYDYWEENY